ncbi:unnamed protein product [Candidula unifasciata]|uniref:PDZ domain-containing protein n=1 Tax=Candidula unifasciata TaxID=100452 RepID=A0A8S3ZQN9_9EUPU|nr:unnamed protein product [Candidula unifasciata]
MPGSRLNVHLTRHSPEVPWGFRLQGGRDLNQALTVQRVFSNSPAEGELQRGDVILSVNNVDASYLTQAEAQNLIKQPGAYLHLVVNRPPPRPSAGIVSPHGATQEPSHQVPISSSPSRPITIQMTQPSFSASYNGPSQQPQYRPPHQPLHVYASPGPNFHHNFERQRSSYSQPPSTPTPTTPVPPWAAQQSAPKKVTKLTKLGGGGLDFGTVYATLPRGASAHYSGRSQTQSQSSFDGPQEQEPERRATGPIPKVCRLRNLGGGGFDFGSTYGAATLPRQGGGRRMSQPVKMPSAAGFGYQPSRTGTDRYGGGAPQFGSDYSYKGYGQPSTQRVQTNLDYTPGSRASEVTPSSQNYPAYEQPYQQQKVYTPTALLLEQQRLQEQQQEDGEAILPVWERRRQFQQSSSQSSEARTPRLKPAPKFTKPSQAPTSYSSLGTDYTRPSGQQPTAAWSTQNQYEPTQVPIQRPASTAYTPITVQYSSQSQSAAPATAPKPSPPAPGHVQSTAPSWQRHEEEDRGLPTWRSSLKPTGVKPWEAEESYATEQPPASKPTPSATTPSGDRDWSQSAVLRILSQEDGRGKQPPPPVAPKPQPQYSSVPASQHYQSSFYDEVAASDF